MEAHQIKAHQGISSRTFGTLPDGNEVTIFTLKGRSGLEVSILNYGGIIQSILTPDKYGTLSDVVLGYDHLEGYLNDDNFMGAVIGRYANRINGGQFSLDGQTYHLKQNEGQNTLHGGGDGFDQILWDARIDDDQKRLILSHVSPDGHQGFPGELRITLTYLLEPENGLKVVLNAESSCKTILNLTLHPYFNLSGVGNRDIRNHELCLNADKYLDIDPAGVPTGKLGLVQGSPMDFRKHRQLGSGLDDSYPQIQLVGGYDHNWVLNDWDSSLHQAASLQDPLTGRTMNVSTTLPGLQVYSGNFLSASLPGKQGMEMMKYGGVCLEPQFFPDAPNQPEFPDTTIMPGKQFHHEICYQFGVE